MEDIGSSNTTSSGRNIDPHFSLGMLVPVKFEVFTAVAMKNAFFWDI
jgi:hypothetical protein